MKKNKLTSKEKKEIAEIIKEVFGLSEEEAYEWFLYDESRILICRNYYSDSPGFMGDIIWIIGGDSCYQSCFEKDIRSGKIHLKYSINENETVSYLSNGKLWTNENMKELIGWMK